VNPSGASVVPKWSFQECAVSPRPMGVVTWLLVFSHQVYSVAAAEALVLVVLVFLVALASLGACFALFFIGPMTIYGESGERREISETYIC
jgi:hypothetical protein